MEFKRLAAAGGPLYEKALALYRISFPFHEQREDAPQRRVLQNEAYHFDLIYEGEAWVGLILFWETADFIYVEHFSILPPLRGRRYGQQALALLAAKGKTVILEIDPPADDISRRRQAFYERAGYRANPFPHVHPPYHRGYAGHRLVVMSCPGPLSGSEYQAFSRYLAGVVMAE